MRTVTTKEGKQVQVDNSGSFALFYRDDVAPADATGPCRAKDSEAENLRVWMKGSELRVATPDGEIVGTGTITAYEGEAQVDYDVTIEFTKAVEGWETQSYTFYAWDNEGTSRKGEKLRTINARLRQAAYVNPFA